MKTKAIVLLSAGLDSTVNLYAAQKNHDVVLALTFDYGQKAAKKEKQQSQKICEELNIAHKVVELPFFKDFTNTSLIKEDAEIPTQEKVNIQSKETSEQTAKQVWVPNRNGIFLNIAAGFAEGLGAEYIIPGFNAEEAVTFPDNSKDFLNQSSVALTFSTQNKVKVHCYTIYMTKAEIVGFGKELEVNFDLIWPCYFSNETLCGECESCLRYKRALKDMGHAV